MNRANVLRDIVIDKYKNTMDDDGIRSRHIDTLVQIYVDSDCDVERATVTDTRQNKHASSILGTILEYAAWFAERFPCRRGRQYRQEDYMDYERSRRDPRKRPDDTYGEI